MRGKALSALAAALVALALSGAPAGAETLSETVAKVVQLKITLSRPYTEQGKPTAWGIDSTYIGPGDIRRLLGVDIYLDSYNRISLVKVTRESPTGDVITLLFNDVLELSVETLKDGSRGRQFKETRITIHTTSDLTFP